jgi:hypothetical protein
MVSRVETGALVSALTLASREICALPFATHTHAKRTGYTNGGCERESRAREGHGTAESPPAHPGRQTPRAQAREIGKGDLIRFRGDRPHGFRNASRVGVAAMGGAATPRW